MSANPGNVIAVAGIHYKCSLADVVTKLAKHIRGNFNALNFEVNGKTKTKTCYLKLGQGVDPRPAVHRLKGAIYQKRQLNAFIPATVPHMSVAKNPKKLPKKLNHSLGIPIEEEPHQVFKNTSKEILVEYDHKFPGLAELNRKVDNQLIQEMKKIIEQRLQEIMDADPDTTISSFKLSTAYRKRHPHFGDFHFVQRILHGIQDAMGVPKEDIDEAQLSAIKHKPKACLDMPYEKVRGLIQRYGDLASNKVTEHIRNLDCRSLDSDTEEMNARKKVRHELKTMAPFINLIVREILEKKFSPDTNRLHKMRIYGEPFLPSKEAMSGLMRRHRAVLIKRSPVYYNLLLFTVADKNLHGVLAENGTEINGAKLVIRPLSHSEKKRMYLSRKMKSKDAAMSDDFTSDDDNSQTSDVDEEDMEH